MTRCVATTLVTRRRIRRDRTVYAARHDAQASGPRTPLPCKRTARARRTTGELGQPPGVSDARPARAQGRPARRCDAARDWSRRRVRFVEARTRADAGGGADADRDAREARADACAGAGTDASADAGCPGR